MISVPLIGQLGKWYLSDERESAIHEFQSLFEKWNHTESERRKPCSYIQWLVKKLIL